MTKDMLASHAMSDNRSFVMSPDLMAFLAVVMWSFSFPASKVAQADLSPTGIVLLRYIAASLFFVPFLLSGKIARVPVSDWFRIALPALIGVTAYQILFVSGVARVTPAAASMIISTTPIFAALLAYLIQGTKLSKRQVNGTALGFVGVALICTSNGTDGDLFGFGMMLAATLCMAAYFLLQKPILTKYTSFDLVAYNTWIATISMLVFAPSMIADLSAGPSTSSLISVVIMGVFSSGLGFVFWFKAIALSNPTRVASFMYLQPVIVGLMAWVWINAVPTFQACVGGALVLSVLIYMNRK
ncbi:MAG: DMT family transporter [Sulfitobacter sp.]